MSKYGLTLILAVALLLTGCKQTSGNTYVPPVLAEEWTVKMTQSGGIMGLMRSIEVSSDGKYAVIDERAGNTVTGELTNEKLATLHDLIAGFEFAAPKIPAVCADCFVYDVEIESGGKKMIVKADDVALPDSGMESLVDFLRGIMDSALK